MSNLTYNSNNCGCRPSCLGIGIVASLIIGIITAFLTFTATITVAPAFLWVLFGIAVVYLAVDLVTAAFVNCGDVKQCICTALPALLTGILGTILFAVILLAITFAATSVLGAVITGALLFFFSLIITSTACLIRCVADCERCDRDDRRDRDDD